jgi:TonB family protein
MKIGIVALILIAASSALASPQPAGKCSLMDDGVATATSPPKIGPSTSSDPFAISMAIPPVLGNSVVDVTFRINSDGSAANPKILCISIPGNGIEAAILGASKNWRFSPMTRAGKAIVSEVAYRLSATGVIPLTFAAEGFQKIY